MVPSRILGTISLEQFHGKCYAPQPWLLIYLAPHCLCTQTLGGERFLGCKPHLDALEIEPVGHKRSFAMLPVMFCV